MKRFHGKFTGRSKAGTEQVNQKYHQTKPTKFKSVEDFNFPTNGGFTEIRTTSDGTKIGAYCSATGEVPVYYAVYEGVFYWSEQSLTIPSRYRNNVKLLQKGEAVTWSPLTGLKQYEKTDVLPRPPIREAIPLEEAINTYADLLLKSVEKRINHLPTSAQNRIAISQSGGLDSFLVTWALNKLGANIFPISAGTSHEEWDIKAARETLAILNLPFYPVVINREDFAPLFHEAIICYESPQEDNLRMASCNLAIAKKCRELKCGSIFTGHGHDDMHGTEGLTVATFYKLTEGTVSERWRDACRQAFRGIGMDKMFATTYRRYGIHNRTPFYDDNLLRFVISLPENIRPAKAGKPFAVSIAKALIPQAGSWHGDKYMRRGFGAGAGYYFNDTCQETIEYELGNAREMFKELKAEHDYTWFNRFHRFS
jgi:hypothetical protein